ncbi:MAG: type I-E CRISPR-associated protein Cas6/Cse3/CasE [Actinomycetaceae bacterium]|nr:type I-E CRISPR-associated protein Cas6/Cse3/CasE [Actinomycetaceae bacterium]
MFISRCEINPAKRQARKLLGSPQAMHAAVMSCFPRSQADEVGRILWRIDENNGAQFLLIVSSVKPDLSVIEEQAGWVTSSTAECKQYGPFLERIENGQFYHFRLTANPVHNVRREDGRSQRFGHVSVKYQEQWLLDRAERCGFAIPQVERGEDTDDSTYSFSVNERGKRSFSRRAERGRRVTLTTASFEGILQVTDADALRKALVEGIGPAKAYGCGLLTLVPATGAGY